MATFRGECIRRGRQWFRDRAPHSLGAERLHWIVEEGNTTYRRSGCNMAVTQGDRHTREGGREGDFDKPVEAYSRALNCSGSQLIAHTHAHTHKQHILNQCQLYSNTTNMDMKTCGRYSTSVWWRWLFPSQIAFFSCLNWEITLQRSISMTSM